MKWEAFGWCVFKINNNRETITETLKKVSEIKDKPKVIIIETNNERLIGY